jgi:hypothetical protein
MPSECVHMSSLDSASLYRVAGIKEGKHTAGSTAAPAGDRLDEEVPRSAADRQTARGWGQRVTIW